jgi:hypothetical protein
MIAAAGLMGLACRGVENLPIYPHSHGRVSWLVQLTLLMTVGAGVYIGACMLMGIAVMEQFMPRKSKAQRPR